MYFIGIDVGTTNCKICLFGKHDFSLISKHSFVTPKIITGESSDFDVEKLWTGIEEGMREIVKSVKDPAEINHISVASVGEAGVLTDLEGNITGPVMTWYDTRTKDISEFVIRKTGRQKIYNITGLPAHSNYSLNKILWIRENMEKYPKDRKWLCMAEYITYKFTGIRKAEFSLASRTMLLDIKNKKWSEEILKDTDLEKNVFSELAESGETVGTVSRETAGKTGLSEKTTVSTAGHDHMCGSVAAGLYDENSILNSTGTTEGLLFLKKEPGLEEKFFDSNFSNGIHVLKDFYTIYSSLPSAGYAIEWFRKKFDISEEEFYRMTENLYEKIMQKDYLPEAEGIFIPHLRGSGPPFRSIKARALFYGITEGTTKEELLLIIFQGLCFELKNLLGSVEELTVQKFSEIKVIGAACRNRLWLKLKADILGRDIAAYEIEEAVCKGAAMLGAYKNSYIKDLNITDKSGTIRKIKPDRRAAEYYTKIFNVIYRPFYNLKTDIEKKFYQ